MSIRLLRPAHRSAVLSAAISSCLGLTAHAAETSAPPAGELEEVVVTGYRASLETALDRKRTSNQAIESIAPEDLGKMPDQNVAESLQRVPGVQINRAGGRGTQVLIQGLGNNLITLNGEVFLTGREFYVSGEASGGGAGGNVQYSSLQGIPSEEIGGIDVIKNPTAANREGGLGGIIDLKTRSALAQPEGFSLSGNVRGTSADDAEEDITPVATLVGGYRLNDRFGITASVSYDEQSTLNKEYQAQNRSEWRLGNSAQDGNYVGSPTQGTLSRINDLYIVPQLAYFSDILQTNTTRGATLGAEFQWTDAIKSSFNYFYVDDEEESTTYSNKAWFNGQNAGNDISQASSLRPGIDPSQPYSIDDNGVVLNGSFMANGAETATLYQKTTASSNNYQFVTSFDDGGRLGGDIGLSYADAEYELQAAQADVEHGLYLTTTGAATSPAAPGCNNGTSFCTNGSHGYRFQWTNGGSSGLPSVRYENAFGVTDVLSNPAYTTFKSNWAWANYGEQEQFAVKGNLHFDATDKLKITGGLRYQDRDVDQTFGRYLIDGTLAPGVVAGDVGDPNGGTYVYYQDPGYGNPGIPYSTATSNPDLVKYYNSSSSGLISVKDPKRGGMTNPATYLETVWADAGVPNETQTFFKDTLSSFTVNEKTESVYVMADAGSAEDGYMGNFGLRLVQTELDIDNAQTAPQATYYGTASWNGVNNNNIPKSYNRKYVDILPSANFVFDATDTQKLRFGAARVVSPQNLMQLGLGNSYNFTRGADDANGNARFSFANGSSGNPNLDPFRASQFNMSWEDYFSPGGLISVGFFYKAVDNFVTIANVPTLVNDDFGGTVGNVQTPVNGGKGKIYGGELAAQYAFDNGFGVAANYTRSNSQSDQDTAFENDLEIPGVSRDSANLTVYYEQHGLSARVAYAWRSKAVNSSLVGSTFSFPDENGVQTVYGVYAADYGQLDAQIGYDFSSSFGILLSAVNLTNEKQHTYLQYENLPFTYNDTGRRLFFGAKFKM